MNHEGLWLRRLGARCADTRFLRGAEGGRDLSLLYSAERCGKFELPNLPIRGGSPVLEEWLAPFRSHHSSFYLDHLQVPIELFLKAAVFTETRLSCSVEPRTLPVFEVTQTKLKNKVELEPSQMI